MESAKRLITPSAMMEEHYGTGVGAQKAPWADSSIPISASEARGFDRRSYVKGAIGALALCCAVVGAVLAYTGQLSTQLGVAGSRLGAISHSSIQSPGEPMKFTVDFTCVPADVRALASTKSPYPFDFSKVVGAKLIVKEMQPELWFRTGIEMTKVKNGVFTVQTNKVGEHDEYGFALYTNEIAYRFGKWEGPKIPRHFFEMGGVSDVGRCSNVTAGKNPCMRAAPLAIADRHPDPHGGCVVNVGGSGFYNRIMYPSQKRQDNYWVFGTCMSKCPGAAQQLLLLCRRRTRCLRRRACRRRSPTTRLRCARLSAAASLPSANLRLTTTRSTWSRLTMTCTIFRRSRGSSTRR